MDRGGVVLSLSFSQKRSTRPETGAYGSIPAYLCRYVEELYRIVKKEGADAKFSIPNKAPIDERRLF